MSVADQDVAAVRAAARELEAAVGRLGRHFGDGVDLLRLRTDAARIATDVDLLAGPEPAAGAPTLEVIPDGDYPAGFFRDCQDEGVGPR